MTQKNFQFQNHSSLTAQSSHRRGAAAHIWDERNETDESKNEKELWSAQASPARTHKQLPQRKNIGRALKFRLGSSSFKESPGWLARARSKCQLFEKASLVKTWSGQSWQSWQTQAGSENWMPTLWTHTPRGSISLKSALKAFVKARGQPWPRKKGSKVIR